MSNDADLQQLFLIEKNPQFLMSGPVNLCTILTKKITGLITQRFHIYILMLWYLQGVDVNRYQQIHFRYYL